LRQYSGISPETLRKTTKISIKIFGIPVETSIKMVGVPVEILIYSPPKYEKEVVPLGPTCSVLT
jgi:hypothetical protein